MGSRFFFLAIQGFQFIPRRMEFGKMPHAVTFDEDPDGNGYGAEDGNEKEDKLCIFLVAFIQAFIFTNLTAVFIGQAVEETHHHDDKDKHHHHDLPDDAVII